MWCQTKSSNQMQFNIAVDQMAFLKGAGMGWEASRWKVWAHTHMGLRVGPGLYCKQPRLLGPCAPELSSAHGQKSWRNTMRCPT